jgi:tetratricopeptide (TPR) repeat protein
MVKQKIPYWNVWKVMPWFVLLCRALLCLRFGRNEKALELLNRAVTGYPEISETHRLRGIALERFGRLEMALADYNQAMDLEPNCALIYCDRGAVLRSLKRYPEALSDLTHAIKLNPKMSRAFYLRGCVLSWLGESEKAIADHNEVLILEPRMDAALLQRANCWLKLGQLDRALSDLDKAIILNPDLADAYVSRGVVWSMKEQQDKAVTDLNEAIRRNTNWLAYAFYHRAGIRLKEGKIDLSIDDYTKAIQHQPEYADCFFGRATALYEKGDFDGALADCCEVLRLAPENALAYRNLGCTLIELARYKEGLASLEKGLTVDFKCAMLLDSIAWILATCPEGAVRDGKRALEFADKLKDTTDIPEWRKVALLAAAHAECGNLDLAVAYQRTVLEKVPAGTRNYEEEVLKTFQAGLPYREKARSEATTTPAS